MMDPHRRFAWGQVEPAHHDTTSTIHDGGNESDTPGTQRLENFGPVHYASRTREGRAGFQSFGPLGTFRNSFWCSALSASSEPRGVDEVILSLEIDQHKRSQSMRLYSSLIVIYENMGTPRVPRVNHR